MNKKIKQLDLNKKHEKLAALLKLIEDRDITAIRSFYRNMNHVDFADILSDLPISKTMFCLRTLKDKQYSHVFTHLSIQKQCEVIELLTLKEISNLVSGMYTSEVIDLLDELPKNLSVKVINASNNQQKKQIKSIMNYSDEIAGSYMHLNFVTLSPTMTVSQAIKTIKKETKESGELTQFYVTNEENKILAVVHLKDIFFASKNEKIIDISDKNFVSIKTYSDREEASKIFQKYQLEEVPVVDNNGNLIGILDYEDAWDIIEQETTEDFEKSAGITPTNKSYLQTSTWTMAQSRIKWLIILMVSATISQIAIQVFQQIFANSAVLSAHILNDTIFSAILIPILPVISGTAGNAGSQSSTVIIRSLALGEITKKDYWKIIRKEWKTSVLVGLMLVAANFLRMFIYYIILFSNKHIAGPLGIAPAAWKSIVSTSFALIFIVMIVKFVGASLPILAMKFKTDPAVMAAPLLTTLTDAISTAIFFGLSIFVFMVL